MPKESLLFSLQMLETQAKDGVKETFTSDFKDTVLADVEERANATKDFIFLVWNLLYPHREEIVIKARENSKFYELSFAGVFITLINEKDKNLIESYLNGTNKII